MLVFPTEEYREQINEYLQEHIDNNEFELSGDGGLDKIQDFDKWLEKIKKDLSDETIENGRVPQTLFLGVRKSDNKVIGTIQIRHRLNKSLLKNGGHIGDGIRPSERKKGYATELIRLALEECKKIGIDRVLMVCSKDNIGSRKSIIKNGGVLENELPDKDGKINQRYWISLKKRYANRHKLEKYNSDLIYLVKSVKDNNFTGDMCYYNFKNANLKMSTPKGKVIIDNNYKLLEFYDYNSKVKLSAFYDMNDEIIEWYFDIAKEIGKENGVPYEDDLYLDIVVNPSGKISLLDEDELEEALNRFEITKAEYEMAYKESNKLIKMLSSNIENLKSFSDKYLKYFKLENIVKS